MTPIEKSRIREVLRSPFWDAIENLAKKFVEKIQEESTLRDTEYETLQATHLKEGRLRGIKDFLSEFYNQSRE